MLTENFYYDIMIFTGNEIPEAYIFDAPIESMRDSPWHA